MSLDDLLEQLKTDYVATIPAKIVLIEHLWETQSLVELETEYHKLKGTGRTYGLPEITLLGEVSERLCQFPEDDHQALRVAVPRTLQILARIQNSREKGEGYDIESDADFLILVRLVMTSGKTPIEPKRKP